MNTNRIKKRANNRNVKYIKVMIDTFKQDLYH
jgi:hypothetical protein